MRKAVLTSSEVSVLASMTIGTSKSPAMDCKRSQTSSLTRLAQ